MTRASKFALQTALGIALLAMPFVVTVKWHDYQLARLQGEVASLPHPPNSKLMARHGEIANFGNGNHLDFWAIEVRALPDASAATRFYRAMRVPVPNAADNGYDDVKNGTQPVEVTILPSPLPANFHLEVGNHRWNLNALAGQSGLYVVEIVNFGDNNSPEAIFDWRAN